MNSDPIDSRALELLTTNGLLSLPIDVVEAAHALRIDVVQGPFDASYAGAIRRRDDGGTTIYVNDADPPVRKRFTIGHEIGHFVLHMQAGGAAEFSDPASNLSTTMFRKSRGVGDTREMEANRFAAALLMPGAFVERAFKFAAQPLSTDALARIFDVSRQAMEIRIQTLGLH